MSVELPTERRQLLILVSISLVYFISIFAISSVNIALPAIASELHAPAFLLNWVSIIFLLAMMMFTLPLAKLADRVGRRTMFMIGMLTFIAGSMVAVFAQSIYVLLIARFIQGVGTASLFSSGLAIIALVFPLGKKGMALGIVTATVYFGMTAGPLLGGWVLHHFDWRFLMLLPSLVVLLALLGFRYAVRHNRIEQHPQPIDWFGAALWSLALWSIFIGISLRPSWLALALLLLGIVLLVAFVKQQLKVAIPLINFRRLRNNRVFNRSVLASIFSYAGNYSLVFLLSLYLQYILKMNALEAGKIIAIQALLMALFSTMTGRLARFRGPVLLTIIGGVLNCIAYFVLFFLQLDSTVDHVIIALLFNGIGFGLFSAPNSTIALNAVPIDRMNMGSALVNLARNIGSTMGMAVVLLLTSLILGQAIIDDSNLDQLLLLIKSAMLIALIFSIVAVYFCYSRKKML